MHIPETCDLKLVETAIITATARMIRMLSLAEEMAASGQHEESQAMRQLAGIYQEQVETLQCRRRYLRLRGRHGRGKLHKEVA